MRKMVKLSTTLLALGTLSASPLGSFGQPGSGGGDESFGPGAGPPGSGSSSGGGGAPPDGRGTIRSSDDAEGVYCEEDGSSAHYAESFSGSGYVMVRYGASYTGCPNHVNWDLNPNSAQHQPTNESIPAYPMMFASGGTTDLSSTTGAIGIMRNGVAMFSPWAKDQVLEYEDSAFYLEADTFDLCGGHSTADGIYHYHSTAGCLQEQAMVQAGTSASEHSALLGWAYDGFPIYGQLGPDGVEMKMCGEEGAGDMHCLDACSGYEALIPGVDDFTYRYYTSCGFDESFFPFTANCYRGCCPDGVTCSRKVEACGDSSPENGYTADYVPNLTTSLDEQYDADLIAGDDTDFIDSKNASVECSLYMGSSSASTTPPISSDMTPAPTAREAATSPVSPPDPAPATTSPPLPEPTPVPTAPEATPSPTEPATPTPVATSPTPSPTDPATLVPLETQSPVFEPTPTPPQAERTASSAPATSSLQPSEGPEGDSETSSEYVEVGTKTTVDVAATAYDVSPGEDSGFTGCGNLGCLPSLAHDGISNDIESRWSCTNIIVPGDGRCEIRFTFGQPMDLKDVQVAFWRVEERTRWLQIQINGDIIGIFESSPGSTLSSSAFNSFGIEETEVESVTFESVGIEDGEWISLLEVLFLVDP